MGTRESWLHRNLARPLIITLFSSEDFHISLHLVSLPFKTCLVSLFALYLTSVHTFRLNYMLFVGRIVGRIGEGSSLLVDVRFDTLHESIIEDYRSLGTGLFLDVRFHTLHQSVDGNR